MTTNKRLKCKIFFKMIKGDKMPKYITLKNTNFEILVPETLKTYREEVLKYSSKKLKEYLLFFKEKPKSIK